MLTRLLSTLVMAPVFLAVIWYGNPYFEWIVALLAVIAGAELLKISGDTSRRVLHVGALTLLFLSLTALIVNQPLRAGAAVGRIHKVEHVRPVGAVVRRAHFDRPHPRLDSRRRDRNQLGGYDAHARRWHAELRRPRANEWRSGPLFL